MASSKVPDLTDAGTLLATDNLYVARGTTEDLKTTPAAVADYVEGNIEVGEDNPVAASQAEMEAGVEAALRSVSPLLIAQAIAALAPSSAGNEYSVRQVTEIGGVWSPTRDWTNNTLYLSTSETAVPPPLLSTYGMRNAEVVSGDYIADRYQRAGNPPSVLLVVGDASALTTTDLATQARLEGMGLSVTLQADELAPPAAGTYALAVMDISTSSSVMHTGWSTSTIPVLVGEGDFLDTMRMNVDDSHEDETNNLSLTVGSHLVTTGITAGTAFDHYTSLSSAQSIATAGLPVGAVSVATRTGDSSQHIAYVVESGGTLTTGTAPARRAFYGAMNRNELWSDLGAELFDRLVYWTAGWTY